MRSIVVVLALALGLKLALNEWNRRMATEEALVAAYGARAVEACRNDAKARGFPAAQPAGKPTDMQVVVGAPEQDVWFWDVGNPAWSRKFRTPYLHMRMQSGGGILHCAYDLANNVSVVSR